MKPANILFKKIEGKKIFKITDFGSSIKKGPKLITTVRELNTPLFASIE
jgi:serine/threonine protein kinase